MKNNNEILKSKLTLEPDDIISKDNAIEMSVLQNVQIKSEGEGEYSVGTVNESILTDEEKAMVNQFASEIDIMNPDQVRKYGINAQRGISDFSVSVLNKVKTRDLGEIGDSLKELTVFLNETTEPERKGFMGLFKKPKRTFDLIKTNYSKAETNIQRIEKDLQQHQVVLAQDVSLYDQMYNLNLKYYRELIMYIIAGKKAMDIAKQNLSMLKKQDDESQQAEALEHYRDYSNQCNRFEKKLHDLELTRVVSTQSAPQIRMLQDNDESLLEKIQSSLINTIPLWRNQMVLALGIEHSQRAVSAQNAITDSTNKLIAKNAETLRMATAEIARESERPIVDIETLRKSNQELIASINDIVTIHEEGARKRQKVQQELLKIETELKQALSEVANR